MKWFFVSLCLFAVACCESTEVTIYGDQPVTFQVEVADDVVTRSLGLMFRRSLDENRGMLFVYASPARKSFWMKNTHIPLDILFIDPEKRIASIQEAVPCTSNPCRKYPSGAEVQFVLEINQGLSERYGFGIGSSVAFSLNRPKSLEEAR